LSSEGPRFDFCHSAGTFKSVPSISSKPLDTPVPGQIEPFENRGPRPLFPSARAKPVSRKFFVVMVFNFSIPRPSVVNFHLVPSFSSPRYTSSPFYCIFVLKLTLFRLCLGTMNILEGPARDSPYCPGPRTPFLRRFSLAPFLTAAYGKDDVLFVCESVESSRLLSLPVS